MKIYSWNMLFRNAEQDRAIEFISKSDFDIFCLQEVPKDFLARLKTLPFFLSYTTEVERFVPDPVPLYLVILSRHPIIQQGRISLPDYWTLLPLRTRMFVRLMRLFHFAQIRNRGNLCVDVTINETPIRIFNLHLILAQPTWRLKEFETTMNERDHTRQTIVCGDFNILEKPHITPINWLLGGRMSDALLYKRERTTIEKRFVEHKLINVLNGKVTHPLSQSQLDHILVPLSFAIQKAEVLPDRYDSDHHPIFVEVT